MPQSGGSCCGHWSADGRYFFFNLRHGGLNTIWALREGGRFGSSRPVQLTFGPSNMGGLITSEDPRHVYVWSGNEEFETAKYYPASGRVQPLLPGIRTKETRPSPDGEWLSYAVGGELWRSQAGGASRQPVTSGFSPIEQLEWSPDARRILFRTLDGSGWGRSFVVSADAAGASPATELAMGAGHNEAAWSPNPESIVFAKWSAEGNVTKPQSGIFLLDLRTSQVVKIPGSEDLIHPCFSPDGRYLAAITNFDTNPNQPTRVMLFDTRSQTWREITRGTLVNPVQWSKDSKYFYYQDILAEGQPSFRYSTAANKSDAFMDFEPLLHAGYVRCSFLSFAPDGALVVALRRNEVNIYRLDLDLP
jgi:hypothetical protein